LLKKLCTKITIHYHQHILERVSGTRKRFLFFVIVTGRQTNITLAAPKTACALTGRDGLVPEVPLGEVPHAPGGADHAELHAEIMFQAGRVVERPDLVEDLPVVLGEAGLVLDDGRDVKAARAQHLVPAAHHRSLRQVHVLARYHLVLMQNVAAHGRQHLDRRHVRLENHVAAVVPYNAPSAKQSSR
jgi:hypothetical protein